MVTPVTVPESRRQQLYHGLHSAIGPEATDTLMSYLPPVPIAELATKVDIGLLKADITDLQDDITELRGNITELRREMVELTTELRSEMVDLRTELRSEMAELKSELRSEMAELRTELRGEMALLRSDFKVLQSDLGKRVDRVYLTLLAGFVSIIVTLVAGIIL